MLGLLWMMTDIGGEIMQKLPERNTHDLSGKLRFVTHTEQASDLPTRNVSAQSCS